MKAGDELDVFGPGKVITDEDTGTVIRASGPRLGKVRITSVDPQASQGEIVEGNGIVKGSIVKIVETPAGN